MRDKFVARSLYLLTGIPAVALLASAIATFAGALPKSSPGVAVALLFGAVVTALIPLVLGAVRTVVTQTEVWVQCGFWGPRVPNDRITACRVVPYDWMKFGGWGIKRSFDGTWAYVLSGRGEVVEMTWTGDDGSEHKAQFSAGSPGEVVAAIQRARGSATAPKARIEASAGEDASRREAEAEAEVDAELTSRGDDRVAKS